MNESIREKQERFSLEVSRLVVRVTGGAGLPLLWRMAVGAGFGGGAGGPIGALTGAVSAGIAPSIKPPGLTNTLRAPVQAASSVLHQFTPASLGRQLASMNINTLTGQRK